MIIFIIINYAILCLILDCFNLTHFAPPPPNLRFTVKLLCDFPQLVTERRNVLLLKNKCDEQALKCVNIASVPLMFRYTEPPFPVFIIR